MRPLFIALLINASGWCVAVEPRDLSEVQITYQPANDAVLEQRRLVAWDALQAVANRMSVEASGPGWLTYLMHPELERVLNEPVSARALFIPEVDEESEDLKLRERISAQSLLLRRVAGRLVGIEKGLEMPELIRLREGLQRYIEVRHHAELGVRGEQGYVDHRFAVEPFLHAPMPLSAKDYRLVFDHTQWLASHGQEAATLRALRQRARPNVVLHVHRDAMQVITHTPVSENKPIHKIEDGRPINGQAFIRGSVHIRPSPPGSPDQCRAVFDGHVTTLLNGTEGPVSFGLRGGTEMHIEQAIHFHRDAFNVGTSSGHAETDVATDRVCTTIPGGIGKIVRRIAGKKIAEEHPKVERKISRETKDDFTKEMKVQLAEEIAEARQDFVNGLVVPMLRLDAHADQIEFRPQSEGLNIELRLDSALGLGALNAPALTSQRHDLRAAIHESTLNCLLNRLLAGRTVDNLEQELRRLGINLSDEQRGKLPKDIKITFTEELPAYVEFDSNGIDVWLRGAEYEIDGAILVGMRVHIRFDIQQRGGQYMLVRHGEAEVLPLDRPSLRYVAQRNVLAQRLQGELPEDVALKPFGLSKPLNKLGKLSVVGFDSRDGWLVAQLLGDRVVQQVEGEQVKPD